MSEKITIIPLDGGSAGTEITAQYNPKELSFTKEATYNDKDGDGLDYPSLYFTAGKAISVSVEFFFDDYEKPNGDVRGKVGSLVNLCIIDPSLKRPPMVQFVWGGAPIMGSNAFIGVVKTASVKYTMFKGDIPVRASVTVSITQADTVSAAGAADGTSNTTTYLANKSPAAVSQDPALTKAIVDAGGDPANPDSWPESVNYSTTDKGSSDATE
jgi:hypothetical protein